MMASRSRPISTARRHTRRRGQMGTGRRPLFLREQTLVPYVMCGGKGEAKFHINTRAVTATQLLQLTATLTPNLNFLSGEEWRGLRNNLLQYTKCKFNGYTVVIKVSKPTINMETDAAFDWEEANGTVVHVGRNDLHDFTSDDINWYLAAGVKHTKPGRAVINKIRPPHSHKQNWMPMDTLFGNATWRTADNAPDLQLASMQQNQGEYNTGSRPPGQQTSAYAVGVSNWPQPRNNVATVQNNYSFGMDVKIYFSLLCKQPVVP